jgi:hypothetical protein
MLSLVVGEHRQATECDKKNREQLFNYSNASTTIGRLLSNPESSQALAMTICLMDSIDSATKLNGNQVRYLNVGS